MHLDPEVDDNGSGTNVWGKKRVVAGFYDGRPNQVTSPRSDGRVDYALEGLVRLGSFSIMGHFLGELSFIVNETVVTFDLSFDNDRVASASAADVVAVRTGR